MFQLVCNAMYTWYSFLPIDSSNDSTLNIFSGVQKYRQEKLHSGAQACIDIGFDCTRNITAAAKIVLLIESSIFQVNCK